MTATPQSTLDSRLGTLEKAEANDEVTPTDADAIRTFVAAYDSENLMETPPEDDSALKSNTLSTYAGRLTEAARRTTLTDADADNVNRVLQSLLDEGQSKWTVHNYSTALRKFYDYHEFGPSNGDITRVDTPTGSSFDPEDVLTRDEIQEVLNAADNPRDRAVFALLIFTGMRNNALRSLRVKDVDVDAGVWRVNDEETEGLKGLEQYGSKRPLLGAEGPVRDWLSYHPASDDPDAYLITGRPKFGRANPHEPIAGSTVRRIVDRLVENTDNPEIQQKPTHPHMLRHAYVTMLKRDYEIPDETVKFLIGHSPSSKVMETTYAHLSDEDHIERVEVAAGKREPSEDDSPLTPDVCNVCGESLPPQAKACPGCGSVYAPDARDAQEQVQDQMKESYKQTDPEDTDTQEKLDTLDDLLEDPEVKTALLEKLGEE